MQLTDLESAVLDSVSDDYESIATIRSDLERDLGRGVTEAELAATLRALAQRGLVQSFVYDSNRNDYAPAPATIAHDPLNLWYRAMVSGRSS